MLTILPLLAGCAVGPDYAMPLFDMPNQWSQGAHKPAQPGELARWWLRLRDPTLNALIEKAVENNLDVAVAKARIREARAAKVQTDANLFPSLDASGSGTRAKSGVTGNIANTFQAGFDASWEIDLFGGNRRASEAAGYALQAAEDDLDSTRMSLIAEVATNYIEARGYQARIALARRTADSQFQTAKLTETRLEAGTGTSVDLAKARAQANSTEAAIPTLQSALTGAVNRISVLIAEPPASISSRVVKSGPIPSPRLPLPTGIPADVLSRRPDVRAAERRLAQETALIGQAKAAQYPSISLTGSLSTTASRLGDLGKGSTIGWSYGPQISLPLFNAGKLAAAVDAQEASRDAQAATLRLSVLTAMEDVENALVSLSQQRIKTSRLSEAVRNYREAARLSQELYKQGTSSFLDVLDAERSLYSAEDSLIDSNVSVSTYYVSLAKALGGGWDGVAKATDGAEVAKSKN